ncbi:hypothetical protein SALWKB12_1542 [Snodgrassella communis]|uniref:Uncharacterized protein n=1 Tax=Snodgrassella communis TaxID=2946699 RepID=A0A836MPV1_9NEIS|nr:hypothetical protein SALWKB12_1542 [Snodgrassella communis]KDN13952.1 hypothetical protein SALWKB29_2023 [Snodgrassella communis]
MPNTLLDSVNAESYLDIAGTKKLALPPADFIQVMIRSDFL